MSLPLPLAALSSGPIFVVGHFRSGTTWVYDMLVAHPEVAGVLESQLFTRGLGVGGLVRPYHWSPELARRQRRLTGQSLGLKQMLSRAAAVRDIRELAAKWFAGALESDRRFLVEKTPLHALSMPFIAEVFPEARFIHVLRDGRDVALSVAAAGRSWHPEWGRGLAPPIWRAGRRWAGTVAAARRGASLVKAPVLEVRYEEMRASPDSGLRKLFEFCEIPFTDQQLREIIEATDLARRTDTGTHRFRGQGQVEGWRERFRWIDRAMFVVAAGDVLAATGYCAPPGHGVRLVQTVLQRGRQRRRNHSSRP